MASCFLVGIDVDSGVAEQPLSEQESYLGAVNRALSALQSDREAQFGVGIEGGIIHLPYGYFERSVVVIRDRANHEGIGLTAGIYLPLQIVEQVKRGNRLSDVLDNMFGTKEIGKKESVIGLLSNGVVDRQSYTQQAIALARFLHPDIYEIN
ncbi:inosine/xanthosine triphosphatase [Patescibacteria group bacterium]|nr:inosine/xanthosine triphosphatase [Patescibacteria group bacterium]